MVSSNILQRTFLVRVGAASGTAFTIDIDGRQYKVTAEHVIRGLVAGTDLLIRHANDWKKCPVGNVWSASGGTDVAVVSPKKQLSPALEIGVTGSDGFFVSEEVFFLGFPYGYFTEAGQANNDYPIPFVKRGIISGFTKASNGHQVIFVDGHNNRGFSGGPVVTTTATKQHNVIGVVFGFQSVPEPVLFGGQPTGLTYDYNSGLVVVHNIRPALDYIRQNPFGAQITTRPA